MRFKKSILAGSIACSLSLVATGAAASGYALIEQGASGMGNAYAGAAAVAEDASTIFFNPAGMSRLNGKQVVVAIHAIKPSAKFSDTGSTAAAQQTLNNGDGGDAGGLAMVPNAYFSTEITPVLRVGLGISAPFGLQTEYDTDWVGRFQAIQSKLETININPSLSYDVNDDVSLGLGINYQKIKGTLSSAVNYAAAAGGALGSNVEGVSTIKGTDSAWGYNLGALIDINSQTRVGIAYRSQVRYVLEGTVEFTNVPAALAASPLLANGDVTLAIDMPDSLSFSGVHKIDDAWDILADATWTRWDVLQELKVDRTSGANVLTVQEEWTNTWRVSAGVNHHYNEKWTVRAGLAIDQSPVPDARRTARIPDNDRTWVSLGGQYKMSDDCAIDFGYSHLFVKNSDIADLQAPGKGDLVGTYKNNVDILSLQYTHKF